MPSKSKAQHNLMAAVAHSPAFARKVGISPAVGRDFVAADKARRQYADGGEVRVPSLFSVPTYSETVAYEMYPGQHGQGDQRDAARHMLAAGTLARKYNPAIAELLGKAHEWSTSPLAALRMMLGLGQMPPDYEPDLHNNRLGIELAKRAKDQADLERIVNLMAERAAPGIEPGRPVITRKARGGLAQVKECSCHG